MEVATGVLSSVITKLGELLIGEYNLQKEVRGGIEFLQSELESIQGALEKISSTPADQLDNQDKIWARDVRELSYDIEEQIDTFMVRCKGSKRSKQDKQHGFKKIIDRSLDLLTQPRIRRKIAIEIIDIKGRVKDVAERRNRYMIRGATDKPVSATIDPHLFVQYKMATELVGIDEARDELIDILMEGNEVSKQQDKIISIVGFGGLGKTTLANAVYEKIREQFDCSSFASVSRTPNMEKLFKVMLRQLDMEKYRNINGEKWDEGQLIRELRKLLQKKRYLVVIDDVWDITVWKMIKYALPDDTVGHKIITTTRIVSVAEEAGFAYKIKPLSLQKSRKLLYKRIFGKETTEDSEEPSRYLEELAEVSDRILTKCAGVPLAIITISSLLASKGRSETEWYELCNSIGTGMENSLDANNMRKILSYSYYDLPSHLRTCLLYISMFPEDFVIDKDRLIWLWIAEGFIQRKEQRKSLFELGESYFNELVNRSMIQPTYHGDDFNIEITGCRVHDMVLDLICLLSSAENFAAVFSAMDQTSIPPLTRRLSIQHGKVDHGRIQGTRSMQEVRSLLVFTYTLDQMPTLQCFKVLRVLDLQGCRFLKGHNLKYLGNLFQLRYLNLMGTFIDHLPKEVGNLQFLETLDVRANIISRDHTISCLPPTVSQLKHLMRLFVDWGTRVPNVIGSLKSLEELSLSIYEESRDNVEALGLLTELRRLYVCLFTDKWNKKLMESICKLQKIQYLHIRLDVTLYYKGLDDTMKGLDAWVAAPHLRRLETNEYWFSTLPAWMHNNPSHLPLDLSILDIAVREVRQEDLKTLGRLPSLRSLKLYVDHVHLGIYRRFVIGAGSFPCLLYCELRGFVAPVMFQQGAMPRLRRLMFGFYLRDDREMSCSHDRFNLGLGNLPSIQSVTVFASEEEMKEAMAAVRKETEIHPNRPTTQWRCAGSGVSFVEDKWTR